MSRRFLILLIIPLFFSSYVSAQIDTMKSVVGEDSIQVVHKISFTEILDSLTTSHFGEGKIVINQRFYMVNAMEMHLSYNEKRAVQGFRISIFSDNRRNARDVSQALMDKFSELYPDVKVYRTYTTPYFKVRVGDFRTRSEAMKFLETIKPNYPGAFVVREDHVNLFD